MIYEKVIKSGKFIFLETENFYTYDEIICGVIVKEKKICTLSSNTYRGFHRIDKTQSGASVIFTKYLKENKEKILEGLKKINTSNCNELDVFEDKICDEIKQGLKNNIKCSQLESYNKIRKPIDIVVEHIIALAKQITPEEREKIIPLLYLPLDSQIFKQPLIFAEKDLECLNIKRNFSFQSITTKTHYNVLQDYLKNKCNSIADNFHRIYFDMFWGNRYQKQGKNLFEINTGQLISDF